MKKAQIKVRLLCSGAWDLVIAENKKVLFINMRLYWMTKRSAIRNAKAIAKRIGIPYDPEIIKQKGC